MRVSIKYKLYLTFLSAHVLVYAAMYSIGYYNFNKGFLDYISRIEERQVPALVDGLADFYRHNGTWESLSNDFPKWSDLIRASIESSTDPELIALRRQQIARPTPGFTQNDWYYTSEYSPARPYLHLLRADQSIVLGTPGIFSPLANLNPIEVNGVTVGYLAVTSRQQLSEQADLLFAQQQQDEFFLLAMGLGILSALVAFPAAAFLTRPVREIVNGTRALTNGDYSSRIKAKGTDELSQLSEDFNTLALTLEQNRTARQQWIADISHELRTPLSILQGELESVQDGIRPLTPETMDSLHHEVVRLNSLVNDLHELSLSDVGALVYKKEPINISAVLQRALDMYRHQLSKLDISLKLSFNTLTGNEDIYMLCDENRIYQLFDNLLQNTFRYTDEHGTLEVSVKESSGNVIIQWQDSGPGVNDDDLEHLFERLYRVENSRNRANGGSGLGLAICKNIVEAHDGNITATHSKLGGLNLILKFPTRLKQIS